jgi:hypothetical protein
LKVVKRITRCAAINVDPQTAARDLDIPTTIMRRLGHTECGIYADVIAGGSIAVGDTVAPEQPELSAPITGLPSLRGANGSRECAPDAGSATKQSIAPHVAPWIASLRSQ